MTGDELSFRPDERSAKEEAAIAKEKSLRWQGRVLSYILEEDPHQLTDWEIVRELAGEQPDLAQGEAIAKASEELIRAGLLRRCERLLLPTRAARHFARLEVS